MLMHQLGSEWFYGIGDRASCMGMSDFYGPADRQESIATIHAALDAGITLLDTGDYGMGHNEHYCTRRSLDGGEKMLCCQIWGTTLSGRQLHRG